VKRRLSSGDVDRSLGTLLVTAEPSSRLPGAVPTAPIGRHLAAAWADDGGTVVVAAPPAEHEGWPAGSTVVAASVAAGHVGAVPFETANAVFLAGLAGTVPAGLRVITNGLLRASAPRVVVLASHGSQFETEDSAETWEWLAFERALTNAEAAWTYLRPSGVFANAVHGGYPISGSAWAARVAAGQPLHDRHPDVPYPFIDEIDVAGVAAAMLSSPQKPPPVIDTSGEMISARARAATLAELLGRPVPIQAIDSDDQAHQLWTAEGWPDVTIEVTLFAERYFAEHLDQVEPVIAAQTHTTEDLLGRPVRSFRDWATDNLNHFSP
jgi:nucleoside-diphosphate-sugar epimerase